MNTEAWEDQGSNLENLSVIPQMMGMFMRSLAKMTCEEMRKGAKEDQHSQKEDRNALAPTSANPKTLDAFPASDEIEEKGWNVHFSDSIQTGRT